LRRNESRPTDTILLFYGFCLMENHSIGWLCSKPWNSSRQFVAACSPTYKIPAALLLSNLSQSKQQKPVDIFRALQLFSRRAQASLPALGTRRTTQALNGSWPWIPSVSSLVRAPPPQLLYRASSCFSGNCTVFHPARSDVC